MACFCSDGLHGTIDVHTTAGVQLACHDVAMLLEEPWHSTELLRALGFLCEVHGRRHILDRWQDGAQLEGAEEDEDERLEHNSGVPLPVDIQAYRHDGDTL